MYKNILVPIAFDETRDSEGAIAVAKALADKGARITLLHVMEFVPAYAITYLPTDYLESSRKAIAVSLQEQAAKIENGVGVLVEGHSGKTILEWADENAADCIVIASHRPGAADLILGSTAARVVRHAKCAVHVVR